MKWTEYIENEILSIGDDLVVEAMECSKETVALKAYYVEERSSLLRNIGTAAACILLALAMTVSFVLMRRSITPGGQPTSDTETETSDTTGNFEESSEMNYLSTDEWDYYVTEDGAVLIGYHGEETEVTVPSVIEGIPVYTLKQRTLENVKRGVFYKTNVTHVTIPGTISYIGEGAFYDCGNLNSVTLEYGVEKIGMWSFYKTSIEYLYLPDSVEYIGESAFSYCDDLKFVDMGRNVKSVREWAFNECISLTSVSLPSSLKKISQRTFFNCTSLSSVVISEGIELIEEYAFRGCTSLLSVAIPSSVGRIEDGAFSFCGLRDIILNEGLKSIGDLAFCAISADEIIIPDGVEEIGYDVFSSCENLERISLPNSLVCTGDYFFGSNYYAADKTIYYRGTIDEWHNIKRYNYVAESDFTVEFEKCSTSGEAKGYELRVLHYRNESIGQIVITGYSGNETELIIPSEIDGKPVEGIFKMEEETAVFGKSVTKIVVPDSVKTISSGAFADMPRLEEVYLGNGVSEIGSSAFSQCDALRKVILGDSVNTIGDAAFFDCDSLEEIEFGANVKYIGEGAFCGCSSLKKITFGGELSSIGDVAFRNCTSLTEVMIPYVANLGIRIFADCTALEKVTINDVTNGIISRDMFQGCIMLKTVEVSYVRYINWGGF